jgi:anti-sigma B factor antagonist
MELSDSKRSGTVIVSVKGRVDASSSSALEQRLLRLIKAGERQIIVDCADLDYISSAGLRALLVAVKQLNTTGGKMALGALKADIHEVFDVAGFSSILPIHPNVDAALAQM